MVHPNEELGEEGAATARIKFEHCGPPVSRTLSQSDVLISSATYPRTAARSLFVAHRATGPRPSWRCTPPARRAGLLPRRRRGPLNMPFIRTQALRNWMAMFLDGPAPPPAPLSSGLILRQLFDSVSSTCKSPALRLPIALPSHTRLADPSPPSCNWWPQTHASWRTRQSARESSSTRWPKRPSGICRSPLT
jgi:hypothetical protein